MESATQPDATATAGNGAAERRHGARDLRRPPPGRRLGDPRARDRLAREQVAATVARVRANQPAWEAIGFSGRRRWLENLRDWILANQDAARRR